MDIEEKSGGAKNSKSQAQDQKSKDLKNQSTRMYQVEAVAMMVSLLDDNGNGEVRDHDEPQMGQESSIFQLFYKQLMAKADL